VSHSRIITMKTVRGTMGCLPHPLAKANGWRVARAKAATGSMTFPCAILPLYCCVTGRGAAVGNAFVEAGIAVSGSGVPAEVESVGLLVEDGAVAESIGLLGGAGAVVGGVGWAVVWWLVDGALVVCPCWLHP